jgi:DNA helicase-2/ATP-dependent DNA helicase PcrA
VGKITAAAQQHGVSLWEVLSSPLEYNLKVNKGTANRLAAFQELISDFIEKNDKLNAFELAQEVIKGSGIGSEAYNDLSPEGVSREQNIQELLNAMSEFVSTRLEEGNEEVSLVDFLSEVSLLSDQDTDKEAELEKVTMMTVHAAKGLEFNHVFVVGMEEDLFPSGMALWEPRGVEEERRLFYVAITRAKKTCTITHARSRYRNGTTQPAKKSRFLQDINPRFLSMNDTRVGSNTKRGETNDGFWGSLRAQRQQRYQKMTPVVSTAPSKPLSKEAQALKKDDVIEHERFGRGVVTSIEMSGNDRRAFVEFESAGRKQLLLKFARFKIIESSP